MTIRKLHMLGGTNPGEPAAGKLLSLRAAEGSGIHQAMLAQDRIVGSGSRVLLQSGLRGVGTFFVADGLDADNGGPGHSNIVYPDGDTYRVVARIQDHDLTPGNFITFHVLAIPSGPHHGDVSGGGPFFDQGADGFVRLRVTFKNGTGENVSVIGEHLFSGSQETFHAEGNNDAEHWRLALLKRMTVSPFLLLLQGQIRRWSTSRMTVDMVLEYKGSPRVIDVVAYEHPRRVAIDDEETGAWVFHGYTQGQGSPLGKYPFEYPLEQAETGGNKSMGARHVLRVAEGQASILGPALWQWHSGDANDTLQSVVAYDNGTGDDEHPPVTVNGTTPALLWDTSISAWSADNPGAEIGTGAHARQYALNGDHYVLDNRTGVIPVWIRAYCKARAGVATIRVQSRPWSIVEVEQPSTTYSWVIAPGFMTVGTGPEDDEFVQFFVFNNGANDSDVRAVVVHHRRGLPGASEASMKSILEFDKTTINATPVTLGTIRTLSDGETFTVRVRVKGLDSASAPNRFYDRIIERKFYRDTTVTTWDTEQTTPDGARTRINFGSGVTADLVVTTNTITIQVTGQATPDIAWTAYVEIFDD